MKKRPIEAFLLKSLKYYAKVFTLLVNLLFRLLALFL